MNSTIQPNILDAIARAALLNQDDNLKNTVTLIRYMDVCDHYAAAGIDAALLKAFDSGGRYSSSNVELIVHNRTVIGVTYASRMESVIGELLDAGYSVRQVRCDPFDFTPPKAAIKADSPELGDIRRRAGLLPQHGEIWKAGDWSGAMEFRQCLARKESNRSGMHCDTTIRG